MDERAGSIQNTNSNIQAGGEGRSMSGPERKWMKGQGPYRIKMPHSGRRGRQINE